jgi:transcriptional regulator with XRE-family HTH domain
MTVFDRVKKLCKANNTTISKMEREIGLSRGASYKWKSVNPSMDVLKKLSAYFNVSTDYITEGSVATVDINEVLDSLLQSLDNNTGLYPSGSLPKTEQEKEMLANSIKLVMATVDSLDR